MHGRGPRRTGAAGAGEGWAQVAPGFTWDDLVLPESQKALLQSISASLESGAAPRLLFIGGAGTGKTMACQILGAASGAPVYSLDVAGDSAIDGDTVEELLHAAGRVKAVVVLDHAELLLRARAESRQSSEDLDAAALLDAAREYAGVIVFTSTSTRGVAEELLARFDCVVDFPFPSREARLEIWRRLLPDGAQLTGGELEHLAASFQLPGAAIRECCTLAILAAEAEEEPVRRGHVARALELEYGDRLVGESTRAALAELGGHGEPERGDGELVPASSASLAAPGRRRPSLRLPSWRPRVAVRRAPVLIGVAALLAAGLGFLAGRATTPHAVRRGPAAARQVSIGLATLSVPRAWHRRAAPPGLSPAVAVSPARAGGRELVVGSAATSAPTFLPTTLLGAGATPPSRQIVQLGSLQLYRYVLSGEIAYALPTTAGTIVAECLGAFDASCHGVLASLRISSGSALPLTPSAAYASELDGIVLPLRALHSSLGPVARSAPLNRAAAGAAARLTAAYTVAAGRIRALDAGVAAAANAALAGALTQTADAYRALARALARTGRGPESDAALAALAQANGVAAAAYSELAYFGYRVP